MPDVNENLATIATLYEQVKPDMGLYLTIPKWRMPGVSFPNFLSYVIHNACHGFIPMLGARGLARHVVADLQRRLSQEVAAGGSVVHIEDLMRWSDIREGELTKDTGVTTIDDFIAYAASRLEPYVCSDFVSTLELSPKFRLIQSGVPLVIQAPQGAGMPYAGGFGGAPPSPPPERHQREAPRPRERGGPTIIAHPPPRVAPPSPEAPSAPRKQVNLMGEEVRPPAYVPPTIAAQLEDKYRPLHLGDVLGNEAIVGLLRQSAASGSFQKAYLIVGRPGTGKTSATAAAIRDYADTVQPGEFYNPNYAVEDKQMGISPMLLLRFTPLELAKLGAPGLLDAVARFVRSGSMLGGGIRRFVILDDVTRLSPEAQEVLLPLTERFPRVTFFVLANSENFSPQLHSRMREFKWLTPTPELVEVRLVHIIRQENMPFSDPAAAAHMIVSDLARRNMAGDFRQAIILLADKAREAGWRPS